MSGPQKAELGAHDQGWDRAATMTADKFLGCAAAAGQDLSLFHRLYYAHEGLALSMTEVMFGSGG